MPPLWDMPSAWQLMVAAWLGIGGGLTAIGWLKSRDIWQRAAPHPPKLLPQQAQSRQVQRTRPPAPVVQTRPSRTVTYPSRPTGQRPASQPAPRTRTVPPVPQARPVVQANRRPAPAPLPYRRGPQWDD